MRTGGSSKEKIQLVLDTFDQCKHDNIPVVCRLIVSISRVMKFEVAERAVKLAVELKDRGVVGLDFSGDPTKGRFAPYKSLFEYGKKEGLPLSCHFAESKGNITHLGGLNTQMNLIYWRF